jgi:Tfp pilus assembly protein PilZ
MGEGKEGDLSPSSTAKNDPPSSSVRNQRAELRRHPRFKADETTVQLYIKGILSTIGIGRKNEARSAVNLSEGGILLTTNAKLSRGAKVQIRIEIEKFKDVIEAEGTVAWCFQNARDTSSWYAGISFQNLAPAEAALIGKMRSWFTSPEYRQKSATRKRLAPPELLH